MILVEPIIDEKLTDFERNYMGLYLEADGDPPKKARTREIKVTTGEDGKSSLQINGKDKGMDDISLDEDDDDNMDFDDSDSDGPMMEPDDDLDDDDLGEDDGDDMDTGDEPVMEPDDDGNMDDAGGDDTGDDGGDGPIMEPDDDGNTDGGDTDGDAGGDDNSGDNSSNDSGDKEEAIHKQSLFIKFNNLYDSIGKYTIRLDQVVGKTDELNHQYRIISGNLKKLKEFLYDYMVIRFKDASYVECMLYYQRSVATINLCFDMIQELKKQESNL